MLTYDELKTQPRKFASFTSLTPEKFNTLLPAFERAYLKKHPVPRLRNCSAVRPIIQPQSLTRPPIREVVSFNQYSQCHSPEGHRDDVSDSDTPWHCAA
jgi:hypothetical protein